jgi:MFS transporter, DHA2 family, methylenomycin A resistance protein
VTSPTAAGGRPLSVTSRRRLTLMAMCIAQFMVLLDVTIVNVALPSMQRELRMSPGNLEWIVSAYALSLAALIPLGGGLGDRYGRKRLFLIGMTVFVIGSVACALSPTGVALIGARGAQGIGGAAMTALTLSILTETYPRELRAGAIGTWAAIGGLGFGAGPVVGGVLLTYFGWSSVFWVNLPIGLAGLAVAALAVTESSHHSGHRLDLPGAASSALGLLGVTLGLTESSSHSWGSAPVLAPLVIGAALLAAFAGWERRCPAPMLPPALLGARSFATGSAVYLLSTVGVAGMLFYVTLLYQNIDGWSVLRTGLSWLFMNVPYLLIARRAGWLHQRLSSAVLVVSGCLISGTGILVLSTLTASTPFPVAALGYTLFGLGSGIVTPGLTHAAMRDVPPAVSGAASGVLNASRQIGTSIGLAVLGTVGVNAAVANWTGKIRGFPAHDRGPALAQAQNVSGARITTVTKALGAAYRDPAAQSFLHGYHLATAVAGLCTITAALVGAIGLRARRQGDRQGDAAAASPSTSGPTPSARQDLPRGRQHTP